MSRGLALLFGAGAALVAVTLVLPHRDGEAMIGLLIPVGFALLVVPVLLVWPARWPPAVHSVVLAFGSVLIALCVNYGGPAGGVYAFMYVWVALYAGAFFGLRQTLAHVAFASATYIVVLATGSDLRPPGAQWLMAAGTSAVVAGLVLTLTRELRARAADLAAVTSLANQIGSASEISGQVAASRVCEGVRRSTHAASVMLLEELADGSGLHVVGSAGTPGPDGPFETTEGLAVLDRAYRSGRQERLGDGGRVVAIVEPVRSDQRVAGLLAVAWARPLRRLTQRVAESAALFAAEAGVALERIAHQTRERERRALLLNDEIVQGLVVAKYALRRGRVEQGERVVDETLDRAKKLVDRQLDQLHGPRAPEPGSLRVGGREDGGPAQTEVGA